MSLRTASSRALLRTCGQARWFQGRPAAPRTNASPPPRGPPLPAARSIVVPKALFEREPQAAEAKPPTVVANDAWARTGGSEWLSFGMFGDTAAAKAFGLPVTTSDIARAVVDVLAAREAAPPSDPLESLRASDAVVGASTAEASESLSAAETAVLVRHALTCKETSGEATFAGRDIRGVFPPTWPPSQELGGASEHDAGLLENVTLSVECLERVDCSAMTWRNVHARGVRFSRGSFARATFVGCTFVDCTFEGALFALAQLRDCRFERCRFDFANFVNANVADNVAFVECDVDLCDFSNLAVSSRLSSAPSDVARHQATSPSGDNAPATNAVDMGTRFVQCKNWSYARRIRWRQQ